MKTIRALIAANLALVMAVEPNVASGFVVPFALATALERPPYLWNAQALASVPAWVRSISPSAAVSARHSLPSGVFVNKVPVRVMFVSLKSDRYPAITEALGVASLAGDLKAFYGDDVVVEILDMQLVDHMAELKSRLSAFHPDVVGFSLKLGSLNSLQELTGFIDTDGAFSAHKPVIVVGGILATFAAKEILDLCPQALVGVGEGEAAMRGIVRLVRGEIDREAVPGIVFRSGQLTIPTPRQALPMADIGLPLRVLSREVEARHGNAALETSRGCPWSRCIFCARPMFYMHRWVGYPLERVMADLREIYRRGVRNVFILDDDFLGGGLARARDFARRIIDSEMNGHLSFSIDTSVARIRSGIKEGDDDTEARETLKLLQKAGMHRIFLGLESASLTQLKRYQKNLVPEDSEMVVALVRELGLNLDMNLVIFDPQLTLDELAVNMDFIRRLDLVAALSAPLNKLRAHTGTACARQLQARRQTTAYHVDYALYDYEFDSPQIQNIYAKAKKWEEQAFSLVYALKGLVRFYWISDAGMPIAVAVKGYLDAFKRLDFDVLEALARNPDVSDEEFALLCAPFRQKMLDLLERMGRDLQPSRYPELAETVAVLEAEIAITRARLSRPPGTSPVDKTAETIASIVAAKVFRSGDHDFVVVGKDKPVGRLKENLCLTQISVRVTPWYRIEKYRSGIEDQPYVHVVLPLFGTDTINRDSLWQQRAALSTYFKENGLSMAILLPIAFEALTQVNGEGNGLDGVYDRFLSNNQERYQRQMRRYASGEVYDPGSNTLENPGYSHVAHFSWIYFIESGIIEALSGRYPGVPNILELGSAMGEGVVAKTKFMTGRELQFVGVDNNEQVRGVAENYARRHGIDNARFVLANVLDPNWQEAVTPYGDEGRFDVVIASHLLEHLKDAKPLHILMDWLKRARHAMVVSVPFEAIASQGSSHERTFSADILRSLGTSLVNHPGYLNWRVDLTYVESGILVFIHALVAPERLPVGDPQPCLRSA
jgi:radical SAM superfamily enzyme YgiQ (UPF0313 family)/2-polyprenyl-3-methyl-5-hydroxy-6-metoxy-1,4-benzoquinol methylase